MRHALLAVLLLALIAVPAAAQAPSQVGQTVTVELLNGDRLTGTLEQSDGVRMVLLHPMLGRLEIDHATIKPPPPPAPVEPVSPWSGKFDLALNATEGNAVNGSFRSQLDVKHEDDEAVDAFTIWYRRATVDHDTSEAKFFSQLRHEWKLGADTPWRTFVQATYDRDQFVDFDGRLAVAGGAAYQFRKDEEHDVVGRLGAGVSRKFGIARNVNPTPPPAKVKTIDEDTNYEALFGLDWAWTLSALSKFTFTGDLYPSVNDSGEYRSVMRLAYETKLDADSAWFLKLGTDRFHDTEPGDGKRTSDYNYYLGLGRTF